MIIRKAEKQDISSVAAIYDIIHTEEEAGRVSIGWIRSIYPTKATVETSVADSCLYVMEDGGEIVASARINDRQEPAYSLADWMYDAKPQEVLVLHTLTVDPRKKGRGYGTAFVDFYEKLARERGCKTLRMDTNVKNVSARQFYAKLGFREAGVVPCTFNGIHGVSLVCLEKIL